MKTIKHTISTEQELRNFLFHKLNYDHKYHEKLVSKSTTDLLIILFNWQSMIVSSQPRNVHFSNSLLENQHFENYSSVIQKITDKIKSGYDILPHLSKKTFYSYEEHSDSSTDLDLLLNDWGIHHLHLSEKTAKNSQFFERTKLLLFAIFKQNDAYFIDIFDHSSWTNKLLLEIIVKEWENEDLIWEIKGLSTERNITDEKLKELRKCHIGYIITIAGKNYHPRGVITSSGHSAFDVEKAGDIMQKLKSGVGAEFEEVQ